MGAGYDPNVTLKMGAGYDPLLMLEMLRAIRKRDPDIYDEASIVFCKTHIPSVLVHWKVGCEKDTPWTPTRGLEVLDL